jgi:hypothetical protein
MAVAIRVTCADRISLKIVRNDRNRVRRVICGAHRRRANRKHDVHIVLHKLASAPGNLQWLAVAASVLENYILALDPTAPPKLTQDNRKPSGDVLAVCHENANPELSCLSGAFATRNGKQDGRKEKQTRQ